MTSPSGRVLGRGLGFPFRLDEDRRIAWSEGEANVREAIAVILRTEPGERLNLPDFGTGLRELLFEPNTVATRHRISDRITRALRRHEPRIVVEDVTTAADPADPEAAVATILYRLVATQARDRVTVAFRVR